MLLDCFIYSWQKGGEYTGEHTGLYCHFYMTHVHTLKGSNSTLCTFVGGESYRGDAYTKGEKTFSLFCFGLYYSCALSRIVPRCIYFVYFVLVECWTCIYPYAIVLYWLHVQMIICFALWSLWSFPYDCHVFDQVVHMFHNMFTWSHFTYYIILVLLSLDLPWGPNVFCASVSGDRYICSKCYTASRFRCKWVLPLFPNSCLSLESVIRCFVTV